jgi:hypothetical protein
VADYDKAIPPGKEGRVNVKIDGRKLYPGFSEKNFAVRTNDPEHASFSLSIQMNIKKVFEFSKELRWAGFVEEDFKIESVITNLLASPVNITGVRWDDEAKRKGFEEKIGLKLETIEKGKKYRLKVWRKKEMAPESFVAGVVLMTDFPKLKEKKLQLSITIAPEVELHPDRIYFSEMVIPPGATKSFERQFNIVSARGDSLKILKVEPTSDEITVKIQELVPGKSFRGTVWVRPSSRIGQYMGSVKIHTSHPRYKVLNLDLIGTVRVSDASEKAPKTGK